MFTGLIETTAKIIERKISSGAGRFCLMPAKPFENLKYGESIAVNGACLTLEKAEGNGSLTFHVLEETFKRTNLGSVPLGAEVNLERAMAMGDRFGGHIVTGHIDATAPVRHFMKKGADYELQVVAPVALLPFLVEKGSIAIDGVSLTLAEVAHDSFTVHIIPVTLQDTGLKSRKEGDLVNLEADLIGKYVRRQFECGNYGSSVDMNVLRKAGW